MSQKSLEKREKVQSWDAEGQDLFIPSSPFFLYSSFLLSLDSYTLLSFLFFSLLYHLFLFRILISFQTPFWAGRVTSCLEVGLKNGSHMAKCRDSSHVRPLIFPESHIPDGAGGKEPACQCRRQETWIQSLGWEDPLEKGITTHSSILAWRIPWTEEPGRLQSLVWQIVGCD